jgi:hypothetical protein
MYTRIAGEHYCGLKACNLRKQFAWKREKLHTASASLGITIYKEESDGPFLAMESSVHQALFEKRGPDLRLIDHDKVKGYPSQWNFKGVDTDSFYVVVVGKELEKLKAKRKEERARERSGEKIIRGRYDLVSDKKERLMWEAAGDFSRIFNGFGLAAMQALHESAYGWQATAPKWAQAKATSHDDYHLDFLRRKMACNMLIKSIGHAYYNADLMKVAELICKASVDLGCKLPETTFSEIARVMMAEIDEQFPQEPSSDVSIAVPVSAETVAA